MSSYAILRTSKISKPGNIAASGSHVYRLRKTPNADEKLSKNNVVLVKAEGKNLNKYVNDFIKQKNYCQEQHDCKVC